jgi:hypothetical protein
VPPALALPLALLLKGSAGPDVISFYFSDLVPSIG